MKTIKTLTLEEFMGRLRDVGLKVSYYKITSLIDQGLFDGVVYRTTEHGYLILEKKVDEWIDKYADDVGVSDDIMEYLAMQEEATVQ